MARFSHQREKRIHPTTNATTTKAAVVYSVGFLKKGLDCVPGSAGMVTSRMKQLPLKKYRETAFERNILARVPFEKIFACVRPFEFTSWWRRQSRAK
jgi:hypothetical protein